MLALPDIPHLPQSLQKFWRGTGFLENLSATSKLEVWALFQDIMR